MRSMRIEHHLDIDAPPSVVFALNIDIERWPTLTPTVTSVTRLDEGPLRAGSQALIKQPGQRATVWTVDTVEPDHRFVWSATTTGLRMVATHLVDPIPSGARNLLRIELDGPVARFVGPLLRRKLHTVLETENEGFRREALRLTADSVK
jgi:Polyketide cyclase / dehydrase and lipid transport